MPPIKKGAVWTLVIFFIYAVLTNPSVAADFVGSAWDFVYGGVQNIFQFFDELLRG